MESKEEIEGVEQLLEEAGKILTDIDKKVSEGAGFNVFRLCGVDHYETMHSKILAEFLNPQGSHGQRTLFLKCFQKLLKDHFKFKGEFSDRTSVTTEVSFDDGRLDILIEDESKKSICVIENKIFAGEQPEQLGRYSKWLEGERERLKTEDEKCILLFLTLNGREAWSIKGQERYRRMAYVHERSESVPCLENWINSCCNKLKTVNPVRHTLEQYKKHIINLAKGEQAMRDAIIEKLRGNMRSAEKIQQYFNDARKTFAAEFMEKCILNGLRKESREWEVYKNDWGHHKWPSFAFVLKTKTLKMPIWVFVTKDFCECEVGLWHSDLVYITPKKRANGFKKQIKNGLPNEGWWHDDEWLLWKAVRPCNRGPENGISLDAEFFDNISNGNQSSKKKKYCDDVVQAIVCLIMELQGILEREVGI